MTLPDLVYRSYNDLLDAGWRMAEIDEMDMPGFWKIRAWKARREHAKTPEAGAARRAYIDEIWPG